MAKFVLILSLCFTFAQQNSAQSVPSFEEALSSFINGAKLIYGRVLTGDDPLDPLKQEIKFYCYNRKTGDYIQTYVDDPDFTSKLDTTKPLHIITHGWLSSVSEPWAQQIKQEMKTFLDVNTCVVDWPKMAQYRYDIAATEHVPMVGDYIAEFIVLANKSGIPLDDVTLIGHSLGGHACGRAGSKVYKLLGALISKIFGLDPAGPLFCFPYVVNINKRLDATDAKFVQIIHTSDGVLGCDIDFGHQDFRPDGSTVPQNGCIAPFFGETGSSEPVTCSHSQSIFYYRYSVNPANLFTGRQCDSWLDFTSGSCNAATSPVTNILGPYTDQKLRGRFYFRSSPFAPFTPIPQTGNPFVDAITPYLVLLKGLVAKLESFFG